MMGHIEKLLWERNRNVLILDTSSTQEYFVNQGFYKKYVYTKEALICDFWSDGDCKSVCWKKPNPQSAVSIG